MEARIIVGTERRSLKVEISTTERVDLGAEIAKAIQAQEAAENEKAEVAAQYKADIERHHANAAKIARVLANGYEYREVECKVYPLPDGKCEVVRTDTGEQVQVREMTTAERQQVLPLPEADGEAAPDQPPAS